MNRLFYFLLLAAFVASCSDEIEQVTVQSTPQVLTRAGYDEGAVQWDNVDYLTIDSNPMKSKITLFKRKLYISLQNNNNKKLTAI